MGEEERYGQAAMNTGGHTVAYRCGPGAMVRAPAHGALTVPDWPDLTDTFSLAQAQDWLRKVWALPGVPEAVAHASPVLASRVETLSSATGEAGVKTRRARRVVASLVRYLLRAQYRPTPFGLFAGTAPVRLGGPAQVSWGQGHSRTAVPGGAWIADIVAHLEAIPSVLERLCLMANTTAAVCGDRLVLPHQHVDDGDGPSHVDVSLRLTDPVRAAVEATRCSTPWADVVAKVAAEAPHASDSAIADMLAGLVRAGMLLTDLRPPATAAPLTHLRTVLRDIHADDIEAAVPLLRTLQDATAETQARAYPRPARGGDATSRQRSPEPTPPLDIDLRVDTRLVLPERVQHAAEQAARLLTALSDLPHGSPAWQEYRDRFTGAYGADARIALTEVLHPERGLGYPAGFPGAPPEPEDGKRQDRARRDWQLEQAQRAALDGRIEVPSADVEEFLAVHASGEGVRPPRHTELNVRVESVSPAAVDSGRFRLVVLGASRGAATMAGRFAEVAGLRAELAETLVRAEPDALPVQLSFPPRRPSDARLTRVPRLLDHVLNIGEHPGLGTGELTIEDLAIGHDSGGLYVWSRRLGRRITPMVPHSLHLQHAPPLARFLAELPRAGTAAVTGFSWGAASRLPFLPRIRAGRIVLARAQWRLYPRELPGRKASWQQWEEAWSRWAQRRNVPAAVELGVGDRRLRLDTAETAHLALLRAHLDGGAAAVLTEAPTSAALGWSQGRAHEIVLQVLNRSEGP